MSAKTGMARIAFSICTKVRFSWLGTMWAFETYYWKCLSVKSRKKQQQYDQESTTSHKHVKHQGTDIGRAEEKWNRVGNSGEASSDDFSLQTKKPDDHLQWQTQERKRKRVTCYYRTLSIWDIYPWNDMKNWVLVTQVCKERGWV